MLENCVECAEIKSKSLHIYQWRDHITEKHKQLLEICVKCDAIVNRPQLVDINERRHWLGGLHVHRSGIYVCPLCDMFYSATRHLHMHMRNKHSSQFDLIGETTNNFTNNSTKVNNPAGSKQLPCPMCERVFIREGSWRKHVETFHLPMVKSCSTCPLLLINPKPISHGEAFLAEHKHEISIYKCPHCRLFFDTFQKLDFHCKHKHSKCWPKVEKGDKDIDEQTNDNAKMIKTESGETNRDQQTSDKISPNGRNTPNNHSGCSACKSVVDFFTRAVLKKLAMLLQKYFQDGGYCHQTSKSGYHLHHI